MKKYPIKFVDNYVELEEWANNPNSDDCGYWKEKIEANPEKLALCQKWLGKEITLQEVEENISKFYEILFNGTSIFIVNGYLD